MAIGPIIWSEFTYPINTWTNDLPTNENEVQSSPNAGARTQGKKKLFLVEDKNFTEREDYCENICLIIQNITKNRFVSFFMGRKNGGIWLEQNCACVWNINRSCRFRCFNDAGKTNVLVSFDNLTINVEFFVAFDSVFFNFRKKKNSLNILSNLSFREFRI